MIPFVSPSIDLAGVPAPDAIAPLVYADLYARRIAKFKELWAVARAAAPDLLEYDVEMLETDPVAVIEQTGAYLEMLDLDRVNDAIRAVLPATAAGADLEQIALRAGVACLVTDGVKESDARLLARYLASFSRPAAGSRDGYIYAAATAWPGLHDIRVLGPAHHGRRGDLDLIVAGPAGRTATAAEIETVRAAVAADHVQAATDVLAVRAARRLDFAVRATLDIAVGPSPASVRAAAAARLAAVLADHLTIGTTVPREALAGALYGAGVRYVHLDLAGDVVPAADEIAVATTIDLGGGTT